VQWKSFSLGLILLNLNDQAEAQRTMVVDAAQNKKLLPEAI
jgi:hypothetical protein